MFTFGLGEIAAISTAFLWAVSFQVHTSLSKIFGVSGIVMVRLPISVILLTTAMFVTGTSFSLPNSMVMLYLALAAFLGIVVCDNAVFASSTRVGPSLAVLVQSLSASFAALLGHFFLDERLTLITVLGIAIAFFGVGAVLTEGGVSIPLREGESRSKSLKIGVLFGLLSAVGLASGFLFSKQALSAGVSPLFVALLRVFLAMLMISVPGFLFKGIGGRIIVSIRQNPKTLVWLMVGGACGTLGIWLSMLAMHHTSIATASLLIGLEPVVIIPMAAMVDKKMPSLRALAGSVVAVCGTALVVLNRM